MVGSDPGSMAMWVHQRLMDAYGMPTLKTRQDPLSELIQTILSQNTSDINTARSYAALRRCFPAWEDVLAADVEDITDAIRVGGLAQIKAPRIKAILHQLSSENGDLDLGLLGDMPIDQARSYLTRLHGVGSKTAACVLLFSLGKPALPVDTHVHRVSLRLGLVPPKSSAEQTQQLLESFLPQETYYPFHLNMIRHGRTCCSAAKPQCPCCVLQTRCEYNRLQALDTSI
ncbi:MAG: endonuclease III domain-containing protein [Anaerolineae bacterium]